MWVKEKSKVIDRNPQVEFGISADHVLCSLLNCLKIFLPYIHTCSLYMVNGTEAYSEIPVYWESPG
jgi:hypothetical protein